jgi:hypothetical protein
MRKAFGNSEHQVMFRSAESDDVDDLDYCHLVLDEEQQIVTEQFDIDLTFRQHTMILFVCTEAFSSSSTDANTVEAV